MNSRVNIPFSTNYKPFGVTKQQTTAFVHQKFIKLKDGEIKGTPVTVTAFMSATLCFRHHYSLVCTHDVGMSKQIISLTIHDHSSLTWNIPAYIYRIYANMLVLLFCAETVGVGVLSYCIAKHVYNILPITLQLLSSQSHYNTAIIVASIKQGSIWLMFCMAHIFSYSETSGQSLKHLLL